MILLEILLAGVLGAPIMYYTDKLIKHINQEFDKYNDRKNTIERHKT